VSSYANIPNIKEQTGWRVSFKLPLRDEHENIVKWFGSSVDIEDRKCAEQRPPAWKNLPSWYMVGTNDQMIPPQAEEFVAKRMGATVVKVPASHASLVSRPKEVVDLIIAAPESAGK
jgi:pimeloyl-ACP methyl ester carboxylesterase